MSIFGDIASAIFGTRADAAEAPAAGSPAATGSAASAPPSASAAAPAKPMSIAEVEAMVAKIAAGKHVHYNWKTSIVDLMKLLDLDSSLKAREQLAKELGYTGKLDGSAEMNIWLHKEVMQKLAESGGKVPESLK